MKISFIGGGNMGEAMLAAVLKSLPEPHGISVCDISDQRRIHIEQEYKGTYSKTVLTTTPSMKESVQDTDIVVLAVKPQQLADVMKELKGSIKESQLVLSIIAGATIKTISEGLNHGAIVRAMPNTPARIGQGMTAWTASPGVNEKQKEQARQILGVMGQEICFNDEKYLDMATAVSGSGPAYFFLLAECLAEAAVEIGLSPEDAAGLVRQTMLGAAQLMEQSGEPSAQLRRNVTSPGGTTAAAIEAFEAGGLPALVRQAVRAAYNRAKELGK